MAATRRRWNVSKKMPDPGQTPAGREERKFKRSRAKRTVLLAVLVVLIAVSAYLRTHEATVEADPSIRLISEAHKCPKCDRLFELTIAEAAAERRARGGIKCPACGQLGAEKMDSRTSPVAPGVVSLKEESEEGIQQSPETAPPETAPRNHRVSRGMRKKGD